MSSSALRISAIIVCTVLGAYRLYEQDHLGFLFLLSAALLAYGHQARGPVWGAFREVNRGNPSGAASLLAKVRDPTKLDSEKRAYFELASGLVAASKSQAEAESHLRIALAHALKTDSDRTLAEAILAQLLINREAWDEARAVVERASLRRATPKVTTLLERVRAALPPASTAPSDENTLRA